VSVDLDMNAKATRKVLNEAYKRFQQLPDWPVKLNPDRDPCLRDDKGQPIHQVILPPIALPAPQLPSRALAE